MQVHHRRGEQPQAQVEGQAAQDPGREDQGGQRPDGRSGQQRLAEVLELALGGGGCHPVVGGDPQVLDEVARGHPHHGVGAVGGGQGMHALEQPEVARGGGNREPQSLGEHQQDGRGQAAQARASRQHTQGAEGDGQVGDQDGGKQDAVDRGRNPQRDEAVDRPLVGRGRVGSARLGDVEREHGEDEGEQEREVEQALGPGRHLDARPAEEQDGHAVVLPRVVPGAPGQVERDQQRTEAVHAQGEEVRREERDAHVHREERVALAALAGLVDPQQGGSVVGRAQDQGQEGQPGQREPRGELGARRGLEHEHRRVEQAATEKEVRQGPEEPQAGARGGRRHRAPRAVGNRRDGAVRIRPSVGETGPPHLRTGRAVARPRSGRGPLAGPAAPLMGPVWDRAPGRREARPGTTRPSRTRCPGSSSRCR